MTQAEAPAPSSSPWYVSSAPPRQKLPAIVVETIVSLVALGIVAGLTALTREPWLIPPLAASMALVIGGAHLPLPQPRNVIGGHIMSAIVGVLVGTIGIDALWSGAFAGALALGVMKLTRMPHSPAAATAMIAVVPAIPRWEFVVLIGSAAAILVAVGLVGNKINRAKYPHFLVGLPTPNPMSGSGFGGSSRFRLERKGIVGPQTAALRLRILRAHLLLMADNEPRLNTECLLTSDRSASLDRVTPDAPGPILEVRHEDPGRS